MESFPVNPYCSSEICEVNRRTSEANALLRLVEDDLRHHLLLSLARSPHSSYALDILPIGELSLNLFAFSFQLAPRYRLCLPIFPPVCNCPKCGISMLDIFGDHAINCASQPGYKMRHDSVKDILFALDATFVW